MEIIQTGFDGLVVLKPRIFEDDRGYFYESYNRKSLAELGVFVEFVQDNQSESRKGVVRGLHYQLMPHAQSKLVRVISGSVYDVAVDLRRGSPTFGKSYGLVLSGENKVQLYIPKGFAHGFSVLSEGAIVLYKTDDYYHKEAERGIRFNDPVLAIDWQKGDTSLQASDRDGNLPLFADAEFNFTWQPK